MPRELIKETLYTVLKSRQSEHSLETLQVEIVANIIASLNRQ